MTILVTADLHLNDLARDAYRHTWVAKTLPELLRKHRATGLIILGDLTDEKDRHSSWLVNRIVNYLVALAKICPVTINCGNHDYIDRAHPFFEFVETIEGITWISTPTHDAGLNALFLPHTANYKRDWHAILPKALDSVTWIFTHQTFQGASVGPRTLEGIPLNVFPKGSVIISGDIHVPQTIEADGVTVTYVGAPYLCDFGDDFKPRVLLIDPAKATYKSIPSPGPQKRLLEITWPSRTWGNLKLAPNDILKVRVQIDASQHAQWPSIKEEIKAWGAENGYNIFLVQPAVTTANRQVSKARKAIVRSDEQLVRAYGNAKATSEQTVKTGLELMEKA